MARQQKLSSRLIALSVMQASRGAAVKSRINIARILASRRMLISVYAHRHDGVPLKRPLAENLGPSGWLDKRI
jgi:hypothetical protein